MGKAVEKRDSREREGAWLRSRACSSSSSSSSNNATPRYRREVGVSAFVSMATGTFVV